MIIRYRPRPLGLLACVLAALYGCSGSGGAPGGFPGGPVELGYQVAAEQDVGLDADLTGRISALQSSEVRPQVDGVIRERLFVEGSLVKAGQPLYLIDPAPYRAASESAEAALKSAEAAANLARSRAERYRRIVDSGAVSRDANEEVQAMASQADAAVAVARAQVEAARVNLEYTRVRAPISGHIGRSLVTPGALVSAKQADPIALIQDYGSVYVDLTESSAQLLALRQAQAAGRLTRPASGLPVTLTLEDGSTYAHTGRLEFTETSVDSGTGAVTVRAVFPNPDGLLLPGTYVHARVATGTAPHALRVPQTAVGRDPTGGATLTLVNDAGAVEIRPVTLGAAVGADWIVTSGLRAGEHVVVEGLAKLRPGLPVKPVPVGAAPAAATH